MQKLLFTLLGGWVCLLPIFTSAQNAALRERCQSPVLFEKNITILSVEWESENNFAYCKLVGETERRVSEIDQQEYAIGFEMRLPDHWNQRFLFQGNGGNDGRVVPATGAGANHPVTALAQGFAVISTNAGHQSQSLFGGAMFGFDPLARINYGYRANQVLTPIAKTIVEKFYGNRPQHSYFVGCSNGGRHAMVAASRLSDEFDGFLAGNPGFNLPKAAVQHAWDVQALSSLNTDLSRSLSQTTLDLLSAKVVAACDSLDGLQDGMVHALEACQSVFKLDTLNCANEQTTQCIDSKTTNVIAKLFAGPTNSEGEALYSNWIYDTGINAADWRRWKIQSPIANLPMIATLGASSLANIFTTPPTAVDANPTSLLTYLREFSFDRDAKKIYATDERYGESAMAFMTPPQVEQLPGLVENGGKLMVYHGASDGVFSVADSINWYKQLNFNHNNKADAFARLFLVPGMNHCAGGPATDQFDLLSALVAWVEEGIAPDAIVAAVNPANTSIPDTWSKQRTRPLCSYPTIATYQSGNPEHAASFVCR